MADLRVPLPSRLLRGVRRLAAHATYGIATAPARTRTWFDVRVRRRHLVVEVLATTGTWSPHIAVVAVHPRRALVPSVLRLLEGLQATGATVVLVANDSADTEWCLEHWRGAAQVVLRRPNIGRDVGAYQAGMRFITRHAPVGTVARVSYFNDSVVYVPAVAAVLEWLGRADGCAGLSLSTRPRRHLQSHAFSLDSTAAFGPETSAFWQHYYPSNVRHRVIRRGELELGDRLRRGGHAVCAYLTADRLGEALGARAGATWERLGAAEQRSVAWAVALDPRLISIGGAPFDACGAAPACFGAVNTTHAFGLVATRLLGMPLKLDLVRVGAATADDVATLLRGCDLPAGEVDDVLTLFEPTAERHPWRDPWRRLWQGAGLW